MMKRKLEDLNLMDDFLFQEMMSKEGIGEEFCRILLETILGRTIRKVRVTPQKAVPAIDAGNHGIRLEAYIEELSEEDMDVTTDFYDIEPNNTYEKNSLPKRTRYYDALIDVQLLEAGTNYARMRNVIIIMILPYDPFDRNRMVYTIQNCCLEDGSIPYDDGLKKIYLYTKGTEGNPRKSLRDMLNYMEKSTEDNVADENIAKLHKLVGKVKHSREVGINYMKSWEREEMIRERSLEEGQTEGQERISRLIVKLTEVSRTEDILRAAEDRDFREMLLKEFGI